MSNSCPACGKNLFSSHDMNIISSIQGSLNSQPFAFNFTEEVLYDVSIYMFNEIKHGIGKQILADELKRMKELPSSSEEGTDDPVADLRKEVESELKDEIKEITENQDEDLFSKAERLRRIAQQRKAGMVQEDRPKVSASKKTGAAVRRAG